MIEQLLAEGKLVKVENEAPLARATYRYRGFVVVEWWLGSCCIRPCEVSDIPGGMLDFVKFRRHYRAHHVLADGTKTACLHGPGGLEETLADIDSWWASMRGPRRAR